MTETYPRCLSPRCERYGPPRVISYQYDQGMLTGIPGWLDSITYHRNGLVYQIRHQNDMIDTWTNDPDSMARPRAISFSGRSLLNLGTYLYDGAGNIKSMGSRLFAYDRVSRLTEANLQPDAQAQTYTFDSFGNLNSITTTDSTDPLNPVTTPRPIGVSTATNRLTGASYDGSGNVTSLFTLSSFTYDPFNRVTHLAGTGVNKSFLYDTSDNRVAILDHQAQTEEWHLRGLHDKVVRSYLSSPEGWSWKQDWVYRDGQLVGSTAPAKWREYHLDHLGSPRLVTGPIGLKVAEYHPFPFGEMASENGPGVDGKESLFRYTGHERDVNCQDGSCAPEGQDDLDYMLARFYSPVLGRFLNKDPFNRYKPRAVLEDWSRYGYAHGNPLLKIDPDGKDALAVTFVGYYVGTPIGRLPLGHSGITVSKAGRTRYYEFGRYGPKGTGRVRYRGPLPDFQLGTNGVPTRASLRRYMKALSKEAGQNKPIMAAYFKNNDPDQMESFAAERESDPRMLAPYSATGNNCATFCEDVLEAGGENLLPSPINSPHFLILSLQVAADFSIYYVPDTNDLYISCEGDACPEDAE